MAGEYDLGWIGAELLCMLPHPRDCAEYIVPRRGPRLGGGVPESVRRGDEDSARPNDWRRDESAPFLVKKQEELISVIWGKRGATYRENG